MHSGCMTPSPHSAPTRRGRARTAIVVGLLLAATTAAGGGGDAPMARADAASTAGSQMSTARWSWPLSAPHDVVTGYEASAHVWSPGHRGIDIASTDGAIVTAPEAGRVHFAGTVVDRPVLSLEHADGVLSSFEPVEATVSKGETVSKGQPVAILHSGHCDRVACLHLGARIDGEYISPLLLLGELRPSILLPTRPLP